MTQSGTLERREKRRVTGPVIMVRLSLSQNDTHLRGELLENATEFTLEKKPGVLEPAESCPLTLWHFDTFTRTTQTFLEAVDLFRKMSYLGCGRRVSSALQRFREATVNTKSEWKELGWRWFRMTSLLREF